MDRAEDYLLYAARCLKLALEARSNEECKDLLDIAGAFMTVVDEQNCVPATRLGEIAPGLEEFEFDDRGGNDGVTVLPMKLNFN